MENENYGSETRRTFLHSNNSHYIRYSLLHIRQMMRQTIKEHRWSLILFYVVVLSIAVWSLYRSETATNNNSKLAHENKARIAEIAKESKDRDIAIQHSRLLSCKETYRTIRALLDASVGARKLTTEQRQKFKQLKNLVSDAKCAEQVKARPPAVGP